jgi:predicted nucleotidyltransferase
MQTETANLLSHLPEKSRDVTIKFADKMANAFTDNLVSVILYGSAAGGEFIEGKSDINIMIILQSVRAVDLNIIMDNGRQFFKKGLAAPLVFEKEHIKTSLDTFPIEFSDIKNRHIVLFGADPFEKAEIDSRNLRYQCERELKAMLVNLRRGFVQTGASREALETLLTKSLSSLLATCHGLLWLGGKTPPDNVPALLGLLKETYKIDVSAVERVWRLRKGESGATALLEAIFDDYTRDIARLAAMVDKL